MKLEKIIPNLMVEDIQLTLNYYHGALGFEVLNTLSGSKNELRKAWVKKGEVEIMFQSEKSMKKEIPELRHDEPGGGFTMVIRMSGLKKFYDQNYLTLDVVIQLRQTAAGIQKFTIRDINGYYLTFAEQL